MRMPFRLSSGKDGDAVRLGLDPLNRAASGLGTTQCAEAASWIFDGKSRPPTAAALLLVLYVGRRLPLGCTFCQLVVFGGDPQQLSLLSIVTP